ncbi:MAG: beta-xylosidase [Thalassobius sp.]|nr:beta-xylosidase [Thalassovita sp.]
MKTIIFTVLIALCLQAAYAQEQTAKVAFAAVASVNTRAEIEAGLKSHDKALFLKDHWIRDPYIILGPDDYYYLTGTTPNPGDPKEKTDPYNKGLFKGSIVGSKVQLWKSKDLIDWEYLGTPFTIKDSYQYKKDKSEIKEEVIWAPEIHWVKDKWALVHCPAAVSSLAFTKGAKVKGPWKHPMGEAFDEKHDPSLFKDDDGTWYALWGNTYIAKIKDDFSGLATEPYYIEPASERQNPQKQGETITRIGHEGATMRKIGGKYVSFGTAWSTDKMRKGSYNLYYCVADEITGKYGPRKFVGRFLGHGTPFQTRDGKWWCTAFFNGDIPPVDRDGVESKDLSETAQTINQRGTTIVPLDVKVLKNGEIYIRAIDPAYADPGPDENQHF